MALLDREYLRALVSIGQGDRKNFKCRATGFLIGFIAQRSKDPAKQRYHLFLVTNRHVFEDQESVDLRFNKKDGKSEVFRQPLCFSDGELRWMTHRNTKVDLAVLNINPDVLKRNNIDYIFFIEEMFAYRKDFNKTYIEIGDGVYVLGFPLGIAGDIQNYACVKSGIISRLDKEIITKKKAFLIDSSIFPGNSGGPIIYKPAITSLSGTKAVSQAYVLGVVSGYIPYEEELYTLQTQPPTVVSLERENSGLCSVVPMDFVRQIFRNWITTKKRLEKAQTQKMQVKDEIKNSEK